MDLRCWHTAMPNLATAERRDRETLIFSYTGPEIKNGFSATVGKRLEAAGKLLDADAVQADQGRTAICPRPFSFTWKTPM
jgi:hypothetical protein